MNVVILPEVAEYLDRLAFQLYIKDYFGSIDSAKEYAAKLTDFIHINIGRCAKHQSPPRFKRYGTHYMIYRPNKRTTWYIFFIFRGERYIVRYIPNNHVSAQHIRGRKP